MKIAELLNERVSRVNRAWYVIDSSNAIHDGPFDEKAEAEVAAEEVRQDMGADQVSDFDDISVAFGESRNGELFEVKLADMSPEDRKAARKKRQDADLRRWSDKREARQAAANRVQEPTDTVRIDNHRFNPPASSTVVSVGKGTGKIR